MYEGLTSLTRAGAYIVKAYIVRCTPLLNMPRPGSDYKAKEAFWWDPLCHLQAFGQEYRMLIDAYPWPVVDPLYLSYLRHETQLSAL